MHNVFAILGKSILVLGLGYFYFFLAAFSGMATDSCGESNCEVLMFCILAGWVLLFASFAVTAVHMFKPFSGWYVLAAKPYITVPIYMLLVGFGMMFI